MRVIILPILEQFKPSLLFISAGFDAALGDPLGQCRVTCAGYAQMTQLLSSVCNGKVVVVIEGGYNLTAVANSSEAVVILPTPPPLNILQRDLQAGSFITRRARAHHQSPRHQAWSWAGAAFHLSASQSALELPLAAHSHRQLAVTARRQV
jgi:hypothetical protein